jgi:glucose-1-phosphate adenylyltransferase
VASGAGVTVAAIRSPIEEAGSFGVIEVGERGRIRAFREKPADPVGLPDAPQQVLASMGNYIFTTEALIKAATTDAADEGSNHDIGGDIIPRMVAEGDAFVYDFQTNEVPGATERDRGYWRDVGTLDSYYAANMDLISVHPVFNLYNTSWPIYSWNPPAPPAKFVFDDDQRRGQAFNSMLCAGTIVSGGTVRGSILSPDVVVHSGALIEGSVVLQGVQVGRGAVIRQAIVDKNVEVPDGARIGVDPDEDRQRYTVSEGGVVVIGKNQKILP